MERLEYKGYFGSIEYSKDDNCLFGQVLGWNKQTCITYEGFTAEELYHDFKAGIEHYLDNGFCRALILYEFQLSCYSVIQLLSYSVIKKIV